MSDWRGDEDAEEEEDEEEFKSFDDHIIFLIDSRKEMMNSNSKGEKHIVNVLKVLVEVMKSKIISSDKSSIGAIFFGTEKKSNSQDHAPEGIYSLFNLDIPNAARISAIQKYIDSLDKFREDVGSCDATAAPTQKVLCPLKEALWQCSHEFNVKGKSFKPQDFKRVWIFTNDDNPNSKFPQEQLSTIQVAKDATETGIEISLWHLNKSLATTLPNGSVVQIPQPFNFDIFYNKILVVDDEEELMYRTKSGGDEGFDTMMTQIRKKEFKKRRMTTLSASLCGSVDDSSSTFALHVYKTLNITKKPYAVTLFSGTNEPVQIRSRYIDGVTGETLEPNQITTYIDVQGERTPFTKEDMQEIKSNGGNVKNSLRILYFTMRDRLEADMNISTPYFLFPDDKSVKGSSSIFMALLGEMQNKKLIAIGVFVRSNSYPRIVALIPQLEQRDADGYMTQPSGLLLIPLPYASEIRSCASTNATQRRTAGQELTDEMFAAANNLISGFQLDANSFSFQNMSNPAVQRYFAVVQAVALHAPLDVEKLKELDTLVPDPEVVAKNEERSREFMAAVGLDSLVEAPKPRKRGAADSEGGGRVTEPKKKTATKKTKAMDSDDSGDDAPSKRSRSKATATSTDDPQTFTKEVLQRMTVADLKELCREKGLKLTGKKDELIDRLLS